MEFCLPLEGDGHCQENGASHGDGVKRVEQIWEEHDVKSEKKKNNFRHE